MALIFCGFFLFFIYFLISTFARMCSSGAARGTRLSLNKAATHEPNGGMSSACCVQWCLTARRVCLLSLNGLNPPPPPKHCKCNIPALGLKERRDAEGKVKDKGGVSGTDGPDGGTGVLPRRCWTQGCIWELRRVSQDEERNILLRCAPIAAKLGR